MLIRLLLLSIIPLLLLANTDRALQRMKIEQRVALVIGNNKYDSKKLSNLQNPINDARAMRSKLKNLGFKVYYGENLTVRQMDKKLRKFSSKLSNGGVGLFFFAGHGVESRGRNYLIGKDSNLDHKDEINYESLELNKVLDKMKNSGNRLNIVLLDACRNDPFSRSGGGGLAKSTAKGTFIVYATSPGDVASDGNGKHGAFTQQILKHIDAKGLTLERVFKRVKIGVINSTNQNQRPWVSNDITGDFYFKLPSGSTTSVVLISSTKTKSEAKATPPKYPLTITTQPSDAKVSITNIKPRYKDGIKLASAKYNIKVSKKDYKTKYLTANINNQALNIKVVLGNVASASLKRPALKSGEKEFFQEVKIENSKEYYEMYLAEYPNGHYTIDSKSFLANEKTKARQAKKQEELNAWYNVKDSNYGSDFKKFLNSYPNGLHARLARLKAKKYKNNINILEHFVHIKAGSFQMGLNSGLKNEKPIHRVNINYDFYIGKYEVTFNEYDKFCESTGRTKPKDEGWGRGNRPVTNVSWHDAKAYTSWLSQKTGKIYRLPTEAEWEFVARAGTTTKYSFGNSKSNLGSYAWYDNNSNNKTHIVGQKQANPWGVYDMHGNVWEWCEDWYTNSYSNTPRDGSDNNSGSQNTRVLRGGSWYYNAVYLRSAYRNWNVPDYSYYTFGFRVVFLP
ncbi:SUMF1/EgtB/PvdO family nonheme iron enzyme [Sulfurimonas sp.]|uniref:SUMF1/EgtB/PvdO family nonheme iron enzyme n=1 Tax=Sulfurimonas sp. TaxID=2022749 RepID=UPI002AB15B84|nr:SUMF1/EgtB/PvdO family nonheme iron enzyme [Sulfurimonas sp.]